MTTHGVCIPGSHNDPPVGLTRKQFLLDLEEPATVKETRLF